MACFLLWPLIARAGTYDWTTYNSYGGVIARSPAYTGGVAAIQGDTSNFIFTDFGPYYIPSYYIPYGSDVYGGLTIVPIESSPSDTDLTASCTGQVTATFTWQPASGQTLLTDPPPASVIVEQQSGVTSYTNDGAVITWATGLGQTGTGEVSQTQTASSVVSNPGTSFSVSCSPSIIATVPAGYTGALITNVSYQASAFSITIGLSGTTQDSNGNDNILIGQGCTGSLSTTAPVTFSNYQWSLGPVFDQFLVAPDQSWGHVTYLPESAYQSPSPHWHYYLDSGDDTVAVTCSATASINGVAIGTVQGERDVKVWAPDYLFKPMSGPISVDNRLSYLELYAGGSPTPTPGSGDWDPPGMENGGRVSTPNLFRLAPTGTTGAGSWEFGQLITPGRWQYSYDGSGNSVMTDVTWNGQDWNGQTVLDNIWPYPASVASPAVPWPADSVDQSPLPNTPTYWMEDSPGIALTDDLYRVRVDESFNDYMMYLPPDKGYDVQWVPLHLYTWKWQADVSQTGASWSMGWTPSPPGYTSDISSARCTTHPQWINKLTNQ